MDSHLRDQSVFFSLQCLFLVLLLGIWPRPPLQAQNSQVIFDSLERIREQSVDQYLNDVENFVDEQTIAVLGDSTGILLKEAIRTARSRSKERELAGLLVDMGTFQVIRESNTYQALNSYQEALDLYQELGDVAEQVSVGRLIGNIYKDKGRLEQAISYYLEALKNAEELGDRSEQARSLGSIGLIHRNQEKNTEALEYFQKALDILQSMPEGEKDWNAIATTYSNMGACESDLGDYDQGIGYFEKALEIDRNQDNDYGVAFDQFSIAESFLHVGKYEEGLKRVNQAIEIFNEFEDAAGLISCELIQGQLYHEIGQSAKALELLQTATEQAQQLEMLPLVKNGYEHLYQTFEDLNNTPKAYKYYRKYIAAKDSIASAEVASSIDKLKSEYDAEKKAIEIKQLRAQARLKQTQIDKQEQFTALIIVGIILLLLLLGVIYGRYQIKQEANKELEQKQKIIEKSNEKITASIRYGSRIQNALITASAPMEQSLPDSFTFLKPRDIVTGDFYWYVNRGDEQILAAIDCTGHGVPGAFMTVFGYSLLNKIVNNDGVEEPSQILALLGLEVMKLFQTQDEDQVIQDGMDMALVKVNQSEKKLYFAGANRPLLLHNKEGQHRIKGDRVGLGGTNMMERGKPFNTFEYDYEPGDTFYVFSDGFPDQFGGPEGRKFMSKKFRELLKDIQHLSMNAQRKKLDLVLSEWKGDKSQTDDIIVIGVRLP